MTTGYLGRRVGSTLAVVASLAMAGCFDPSDSSDAGETETGSDTADGTASTTSPTSGTTDSTSTSAGTGSTTTATTGQDTSTTTDPDTGTTDGPTLCDEQTHVCVEQAPEGWNGPITVIADAPDGQDPSCGTEYPELAVTAFASFSAPPAECTCECDPPQSVTCSSVNMSPFGNSQTCTCPSFCALYTVNSTCTAINGSTAYWEVYANLPNGTQCVVNDATQLPPATFAERFTACGGATDAGGCAESQTCLPLPPAAADGRVCVYAEGDMECPAGEYDQQFVYYRNHEDNRSCTTCSCGDAEGNCTGNVTIRDAQCGGIINNQQNIPANACTQTNFSFSSATWNQNGFDVTCPPSGGEATGSATATDPITLCCR